MNLNDLFESLRTENPCWKGYHPVGTKKKDGRTVPNCVPTNEGEGDPEGLPHLTPELASHIADQIDTEGPHAIVKSVEWGDGAAEELTGLIKQKLEDFAQDVNEDWNKVNKKDKTDGMSQKAVNAYRRENPGSKLKTAVTKKPSELKAGSKDAKRRKSFCARMSGNKGPMKDEKGRPTPKAKALSRWNCEESAVAEAFIAPGLSAANAGAEYQRGGGGYRGRADVQVNSKEEYRAIMRSLRLAAEESGQRIECGLVGSKMSIFSDSMNSDELEQFVNGVLENGMNEGLSEGVPFGFGDRFSEQLALQTFEVNPNLKDENEILNLGYKIAKGFMGSKVVDATFRDEDFPSDFVSAYGYLQKQGVAEGEYQSRHIHRQEQNKKYDEYRRNQESQGKKPLSRGDWAATQRKGQQGVAEMDSQKPTGRYKADGTRSHSSYGSRDNYELGGPERTGKALKADQIMKKAHKAMMKSMSNAEKVDKGWRNPNIDEGSLEEIDRRGFLKGVGAAAVAGAAGYGANKVINDPSKRWKMDVHNYDELDKEYKGKSFSITSNDKKMLLVVEPAKHEVTLIVNNGPDVLNSFSNLRMKIDNNPSESIDNIRGGIKYFSFTYPVDKILNANKILFQVAFLKSGETGRNPQQQDYRIVTFVPGQQKESVEQGVAEVSDATLTSYLTKVDADSQKHEKDPTKRSPEKRNRSVAGFARAFNKLDARREKTNEVSKDTLGRYVQKAHQDVVDRATSASFQSGQAGDKYNKADTSPKDLQRLAGMGRAIKRLSR